MDLHSTHIQLGFRCTHRQPDGAHQREPVSRASDFRGEGQCLLVRGDGDAGRVLRQRRVDRRGYGEPLPIRLDGGRGGNLLDHGARHRQQLTCSPEIVRG